MCTQVPDDEILKQAPLSSAPTIQNENFQNLMCFVPYLTQQPATISNVGKHNSEILRKNSTQEIPFVGFCQNLAQKYFCYVQLPCQGRYFLPSRS